MAIIGRIDFANLNTQANGSGEDTHASVYITLVDTATGNVVNGNNLTAYYVVYNSDFANNLTTTEEHTIQIPGQSALIYNGIIEQVDGSSNPLNSKTFLVTKVSGTVDTNPLFSFCDVRINFINIDHPESAPGANNGQITVHAESSYLPLSYSIDGNTFQSSPVFSGLSHGLVTAYVTDANPLGCEVNQSVTIPVISNLLINDPSVNLGSNVSRWNAAFNPIVFTYQRKDFEVLAVAEDGATGKAVISVNTDTSAVLVNDLVYINAGPYNNVFTVLIASGSSLTVDTPYIASATGFININRLRPYYQLQTQITYQDKITGKQSTIVSTNRPDSMGIIRTDISNFLQSVLRAKDESDYTAANYRDENLSASYQISYAEKWDGKPSLIWTPLPHPYYIVYAAKQLGERYGGNLAASVPFKVPAAGLPLAKWVTDFAEPVYSPGYPFDIGFIYSEDLAGLNLYAVVTLLDINKNPIGSPSQVSLLNENGSFLLNQDSSKLIIQRALSGSVSIAQRIGLNRLLFNNNYANEVNYLAVDLRYQDTGSQSVFNYSFTEDLDPFIDGDLRIYDDGINVVTDLYSESGQINIAAGRPFLIQASVGNVITGDDPKLNLTIEKNGTTIFSKTITATPSASLTYSGTTDIAASYTITGTTTHGTDDLPDVNITDTTVVTGDEVQVMQTQTIRIDKSLDYNSIYLRWIGLSGSWNYFRFIYNQEVSLDVQNATIIKNFVSDWENQDSIEEVIGKSAGQKVKVMAEDLSVDDIKGLQSIKYSPKVQMLVSKNPVKWQTIVINTATFSEYETLNGQAPFSVTFNLPSINIQTQ